MSQTLCGFKQFHLPQIEQDKKANNSNNCNTSKSTLNQSFTSSSPQVQLNQFPKESKQQQENNYGKVLESPQKSCPRIPMIVKEPFHRSITCDSKIKFTRKQDAEDIFKGNQANTVKLQQNKCNIQRDTQEDNIITLQLGKQLHMKDKKEEYADHIDRSKDDCINDINLNNFNCCQQNNNFNQNDIKNIIKLKNCQDNSKELHLNQPKLIRQCGIKQASEGDNQLKSHQNQCKQADDQDILLPSDANSDKELLCIQCVNEDLIVEKQAREKIEKKKDCIWMNKIIEVEKCKLGELNHETQLKKDRIMQYQEDNLLMLQKKEEKMMKLRQQNEEYQNFLTEENCKQEEKHKQMKQEKYQNNLYLRAFMQNQMLDKQQKNLCSKLEENRKDQAVMDYNKKEMESQAIEQAVRMKRMHQLRQSLIKQAFQKKCVEEQEKIKEQRKEQCINEAVNQLLDKVNVEKNMKGI